MSDAKKLSDAERLAALKARIEKAKVETSDDHHMKKDYSQAQQAWRMVIELVAGLGIGFVIGYGLDTLFGTMPIFLVIFIFFGFAAGIKTMLRTAKELQMQQLAKQASEDEGD